MRRLSLVPALALALACQPSGGGSTSEDGSESASMTSETSETSATSEGSPEGYAVFVVGDSWAELSQGTIALYSEDNMVASRLRARDVEVAAEYTYGFGGTAAVSWAVGDPCGTPGAGCSDQAVVGELLDDLASAPATPLVYLSLGGNDLRVAGETQDLSDPETRALLRSLVETGLRGFIDAIFDARPDAQVLLPGYANFHFSGSSALDGTGCEEFWGLFFAATPAPSEALVNLLFGQGELEGVEIQGLASLFETLAAERPESVRYTDLRLLFADADADEDGSASPSAEGTMIDCLHLTPGNQRDFVDAAVDRWLDG